MLDDTVRLEAFKAGEFDVSVENVAKQWARGYSGCAFASGALKNWKSRTAMAPACRALP